MLAVGPISATKAPQLRETVAMSTEPIYRFGGFSLDTGACLLRNGSGEISLGPKSFELPRYLVHNAGRVVSKDELLRMVWSDVIVTEDSLTPCISDVRRALGDEPAKRRSAGDF
jgi:adenylate cyclase